jgi:hypothetical protein
MRARVCAPDGQVVRCGGREACGPEWSALAEARETDLARVDRAYRTWLQEGAPPPVAREADSYRPVEQSATREPARRCCSTPARTSRSTECRIRGTPHSLPERQGLRPEPHPIRVLERLMRGDGWRLACVQSPRCRAGGRNTEHRRGVSPWDLRRARKRPGR